jgi:hypothetical protein
MYVFELEYLSDEYSFFRFKMLHRLASNPIFDDNLYYDLDYAWSLPIHPTFKQKIELIKAAIDKAMRSPLQDYPAAASQVLYFMCKIREVVRVSNTSSNPTLW